MLDSTVLFYRYENVKWALISEEEAICCVDSPDGIIVMKATNKELIFEILENWYKHKERRITEKEFLDTYSDYIWLLGKAIPYGVTGKKDDE